MCFSRWPDQLPGARFLKEAVDIVSFVSALVDDKDDKGNSGTWKTIAITVASLLVFIVLLVKIQ
jgi:hypothetical protein